MGIQIDRDRFDESDYDGFARQLRRGLDALRELLDRRGFGVGGRSVGAELELSLIDSAGRPKPVARDVLARALDPRVTLEIDRFNLEYNASPRRLAGDPFTTMEDELRQALEAIGEAAASCEARLAVIGILPTLRADDLGSAAMNDVMRFRALSAGLRRLRAADFRVEIDGEEPLQASFDDVTLEGANTSLQLHLRVDPSEFARTFNAAQMAVAPILAVATNSPILLQHRLWAETRVAVFGQAVDYRMEGPGWRPSRVSFGHGWVRDGAAELFAESVHLHSPLLPLCTDEDALACVQAGGVPELGELRLHHGTVWSWNRAVFDPADGGHLRVELRALPAGPSIPDMVANAAALIGLTLGLADEVGWMLPAFPFRLAHDNFYRAARLGSDAVLLWPSLDPPSPRAVHARDLVLELLPIARRGLVNAGVAPTEVDRHLGVLEARAAANVSGSSWQLRTLERLEQRMGRRRALAGLLERYLDRFGEGRPVHQWRVDA